MFLLHISVQVLFIFYVFLQSTYENFRYRYDQRANPYNRGIFKNFRDVFCTSIPASKNNFRAKIPIEPAITSRRISGGYTSPNIRKPVSDIEMGRKPAWNEAIGEADENAGSINNHDNLDKHGDSADVVSPDLSRMLPPEGLEGRSISHHRRSSWGRGNDSWEASNETLASSFGESKRVSGNSNRNLTGENQQAQTNFKA